jgi:hypothetical protein
MTEVQLPYVSIAFHEGIMFLDFKEEVELGFPEVKELTSYAEKLGNNKPYLVLSDVRKNVHVTNEGKKLATDHTKAPLLRGVAVIINNTLLEIAANFFIKFQKPKYPFKVFTDREEALKWLKALPLETESSGTGQTISI